MRERRALWSRRGIWLALALLALAAAAPPAMAQDVAPTKPKTSSLLLPLPDVSIFFVQPGPCVPSGEYVSLGGEVHVVTLVRQGMVTDIHLNLAGVQGIGQTTGNLYIGTGSQKFSQVAGPIPLGDMPVPALFWRVWPPR